MLASSFPDLNVAEQQVFNVIQEHSKDIKKWLKSSRFKIHSKMVFDSQKPTEAPTGYYHDGLTETKGSAYFTREILKKDPARTAVYTILTAYPIP